MYKELGVNQELSTFVETELEKRLKQIARNSEANDFEILLALKNVVSKRENLMAVKTHSAALCKVLNGMGEK
ncbi:TPA: hypothetical protein NKU96_001968 [Vibrio parahaemolyticus]|nr:hypothetical protein [Vibrio parahaemolyticus]HCH3912913.1 hypothetical protein [Vibrio parahaemolyticus]